MIFDSLMLSGRILNGMSHLRLEEFILNECLVRRFLFEGTAFLRIRARLVNSCQ